MNPPAGDGGRWSASLADAHRFLIGRFRTHLRLYLVACGGLTLVNLFTGGSWWSFTPVCGWGILLAVHYFYVRAVNVDDDWVRERTEDLRIRSYDLGHITDLEERIERGDASVRPGSMRSGSVCSGGARLDSARPGSVRSGSMRPGSACDGGGNSP